MCPYCETSSVNIVRRGYFRRQSTNTIRVQRYFCKMCRKYFCDRTRSVTYREKKAYANNKLVRLLCSGVSQRRCAEILGLHRTTVAKKMAKLSQAAENAQASYLLSLPKMSVVVFDEMETFEHSKCKPISIAVAVEEGSRRIIGLETASMPAKGHLVKIARQKYGPRRDDRQKALRELLCRVKSVAKGDVILKSDEAPRYPRLVKDLFPDSNHERYKGRRGCVVGQGELKAGGWDPLFSLNHTCAMIRDNLKRLSRRTWCTTKQIDRLQQLLNLYICYHNERIDLGRKQANACAIV